MSKVTVVSRPNRIVIASKGVQGAPGPQGEQGIQGPKGDTGDVTPEAVAARDAAQEAASSAQDDALAAAGSAATADGAAQARVQELRDDLADPTGGSGLVAFRQAGASASLRSAESKMRDIASARDFAAAGNGVTNDTAAIQAAVTSLQGKALFFPDGTYVNDSTPAGINNVHCYGSPRVKFTGVPIPIFSGVYSGNAEVAIVAGVIRYYASGASGPGWYFIKDGGQDHDPVLLGPVTASGSGGVVLNVNLSDLGLNSALWTPSGFVVGPDEGLAQTGLTLGASVGVNSITIRGAYSSVSGAYVNWNGTSWVGTSAASYDFAWTSGANAYLTVTRKSQFTRASIGTGLLPSMMYAVPRINSGESLIHIVNVATVSGGMQFKFFDNTGAVIQEPTTAMKFYLFDPGLKPLSFGWSVDPGSTANIWMVGVFRRKPGSY